MSEVKNSTESEMSLTDTFIAGVKERLDSPFLFSFVISWGIVNRDFCFYFWLKDDPKKAEILSNWNFAGDFLWFDLVPFGNSIINPLFYSLLAAILFWPFSLAVTSARHFMSAIPKGWATSGKLKYELHHDISSSEKRLVIVKKELDSLKAAVSEANLEYEKSKSLVEHATRAVKNFEHHTALKFVIQSVNDLLKYNKNPACYELVTASYVIPNCLVDLEIKRDNGTEILKSLHASEAITSQSFFEEDSESSARFRLAFITMQSRDLFLGGGDSDGKEIRVTNIRHIQLITKESK